jgi:S-adenosylmethionine synthetase
MSLEAAAGKNPVSHTGKLYNLLAARIARRLTDELPQVEQAYCYLLSRIGSPITEPQLADIALGLADPHALEAIRDGAAQIVRAELRAAPQLWREILAGACPIC